MTITELVAVDFITRLDRDKEASSLCGRLLRKTRTLDGGQCYIDREGRVFYWDFVDWYIAKGLSLFDEMCPKCLETEAFKEALLEHELQR